MSSAQPVFGGMFRQMTELGFIEVGSEPLDGRIEGRHKKF